MEVHVTDGFKQDMERLFSWRWAPFRWIKTVLRFPREIKWIYQRATRGWADCDTWGFDSYLAELIAGGLQHLKDIKHGAPSSFFPYPPNEDPEIRKRETDKGFADWDECLAEMIAGFKAVQEIEDEEIGGDTQAYLARCKALEEKRKKGMTLFVEHFRSLWD